jgi:predicted permease
MDALRHDLTSAFRSLKKARGFTAVAVLVFALGIGINTALFSIVNGIFFRPLPVAAPDRLAYVYLYSLNNSPMPAVGGTAYEAFHDHSTTFAATTLTSRTAGALTVNDQTESVQGEQVTANYFDLLGVRAALGRTFRADDDVVTSGSFAIVISHRLWLRLFDADPDVVGRNVRLCCRSVFTNGGLVESDAAFTVVGVAPPEFRGIPGGSSPWTYTDFWATFAHATDRPIGAGLLVARLKDGATHEQATAEVRIQGAALLEERAIRSKPETAELIRRQRYDALRATAVRTPFDPDAVLVPQPLVAAIVIVVALVLFIAGANIAGLLTSRGVTRIGETAIRLVLGASSLRVIRQLLAETLLMALSGGILGLIVASWLLALFRTYTPNRFSIDVPIDARVLVFTTALCVAAGIVTGLAPALQALRIDIPSALPGIAMRTTRGIHARLRHWVVVPQVALCLVLLVAAGLHVRALMHIELADVGYDVRDRIMLQIGRRSPPGENRFNPTLQDERAERTRVFYRQVLARTQSVTATAGVALASRLPMNSGFGGTDVIAQDDYLDGVRAGVDSARTAIGPGYFATMGIRLVRGRDFDERELPPAGTWWSAAPVAIVSETLANRLWSGKDPLGRFLALDVAEDSKDGKIVWHEVIGIVDDTDPVLRREGDAPYVYVALGQQWMPSVNLVVTHAGSDSERLVTDLKRAVTGADSFAEVYGVRTLEQVVADLLYPRRLAAAILTAAGLIGLLLAAIGLYGVVSYSVARRVHEMGVRTTLGASRLDIIRLVVGDGLRTSLIGSLAGFALTYVGVRLTSNVVGAIPAVDVAVLVTVPLVLLGVIVLACYIPARRAARVDPLESLRAL